MYAKAVLLLILSAVAASAPAATVYRCQGPNGTTFSDAPCGAGQQRLEVDEEFTPGPPGLRESEIRMLQRIDQEKAYQERMGDYRQDSGRVDRQVEEADRREACRQLDLQRARHYLRNGDYVTRRRQLGCP